MRAQGHIGLCEVNEGVIRVVNDLPNDSKGEIFLHEILHALWADGDIGDDDALEERVISRLGLRLAAFIRDNPHAVAHIQELLT